MRYFFLVGIAAGRSLAISAATGGGLVALLGGLYIYQQRYKLNCHYVKLCSMLRDLKSDHFEKCQGIKGEEVKLGYVTAP